MFSYEFCDISKNTLFTENLWTTAFDDYFYQYILVWQFIKYKYQMTNQHQKKIVET